jgi:hypothetical protein
MARGFESKNVEFQQEEAARGRTVKPSLTPEQKARLEQRTGLELARAKASDDLSRATAAAHRRMLEQAIAALDAELGKLS